MSVIPRTPTMENTARHLESGNAAGESPEIPEIRG
jgi:hypothetical protein